MNKRLKISLILIGAVALILLYCGFYLLNHDMFNSPDETAQAFFIRRIAEGKPIAAVFTSFHDGYEYIAPRSARVVDGSLVPVSFLGVIMLYGSLWKLFGMYGMLVTTGLIAVSGLFAYYQIQRHIWGKSIARVSVGLAAFFPAWVYYANLAYFPNVLLVSLVCWSLYGYIAFKESGGKNVFAIGSGIATALALFVRTAALPWMALIWTVLFCADVIKKRRVTIGFYSTLVIVVVCFFIVPSFFVQQAIYGSGLETGYIIVQETSQNLLTTFFPGGLHPRLALHNFWNYGVMLFWYAMIPAFVGAIIFFSTFRAAKTVQQKYLLIAVGISVWLIMYYGSWLVTDNISGTVSIGVAYVRYWLPLYLLWLPFIGYGMQVVLQYRYRAVTMPLILLCGVAYVLLSLQSVYTKYSDSLVPIKMTLEENRVLQSEVFELTETDSVIVSYRHDKVFFPGRSVIHGLPAAEMIQAMALISQHRPVYWYTQSDEYEIETRYNEMFVESNLKLRHVDDITKGSLYEIILN